jgi:hypothetical protein
MIEYDVYSSYIEESTPWASWSDEDIFHWVSKRYGFPYRSMSFPLMTASGTGPNTVEVNINGQVYRHKEF